MSSRNGPATTAVRCGQLRQLETEETCFHLGVCFLQVYLIFLANALKEPIEQHVVYTLRLPTVERKHRDQRNEVVSADSMFRMQFMTTADVEVNHLMQDRVREGGFRYFTGSQNLKTEVVFCTEVLPYIFVMVGLVFLHSLYEHVN